MPVDYGDEHLHVDGSKDMGALLSADDNLQGGIFVYQTDVTPDSYARTNENPSGKASARPTKVAGPDGPETPAKQSQR